MVFKIKQKSDVDSVKSYIDRLSLVKEYEIKINTIKKKRSISQNALYHMWLNCISKETGEDVDALHRYFTGKYLGYKTVKVFDEVVNVIVSTTKLSTEEFTDFLDQVQMFCETELNIILPNPTDKFYQQFEETFYER